MVNYECEMKEHILNPKSIGRARNETVHKKILETAFTLAGAKAYHQISIQDIANESKVGRQTIYRWWPNKNYLYLEVLIRQFTDASSTAPPEHTSFEEYLRSILGVTQTAVSEITLALLLEAQYDDVLQKSLYSFMSQRREMFKANVNRALKIKNSKADVPLNTLIDMLLGASWYRFLYKSGPLDDDLAHDLAKIFTRII
jgi:AcrR family transcriptional regulator